MPEASIRVAAEAESFSLPGGPTGIFLVHGYGGSIADYRGIAQKFHQDGYSVFGVRLAGHGIDHHALAQTHVPDWQNSLITGLQTFKKNVDRVVVVAASFSGALASVAAAEHPELIQGLVLVNTPMAYRRSGIQKIALHVLKVFTPYYAKYGLSATEKKLHAQRGSTVAWPITGLFETEKFLRLRLKPALMRIQQPTLILFNEHDPYVSAASGQELFTALGSKEKDIIRVPGRTHRPFRDPASVTFMVEKIENFIQSGVAKTS